MPTESDRNCQYASSSSRKLGLLVGEDLKYIIVFTDIIFYNFYSTCPEAAYEFYAHGMNSAKMTLIIVTTSSK
jgi:hypothetical protein